MNIILHAIYVIHQLSGVCVLYNKYGTIEFNEDLIAGFLTALKDFSTEVTGGKGNIKVLDMVVYNIHLVFKGGVLIAAASDKRDSKEIAQNRLEIILNEFLKRYGDKLENWSGDVRVFADFSNFLDDTLEMGKVAEVPRSFPLLKLFEKDLKKEQKRLKKGTTVNREVLNLDTVKEAKWKKKRLPKQYITQGHLTEEEYKIAHMCDGLKDINEIAEEAGITTDKAQIIIDKLNSLGMLKILTM